MKKTFIDIYENIKLTTFQNVIDFEKMEAIMQPLINYIKYYNTLQILRLLRINIFNLIIIVKKINFR